MLADVTFRLVLALAPGAKVNALLPKYRLQPLGTEAFKAKLWHEEMTDLPLNRLLAVGEANLERVEVLEDLLPEVVDGAMALVDDDDIEELGWDAGVVDDRNGLAAGE